MSVMLFSNNPRMRAFLPRECVRNAGPANGSGPLTDFSATPAASSKAATGRDAASDVSCHGTASDASCRDAAFDASGRAFACRLFPGSALGVLQAARDKIHQGWTLLNHPLYGNFRPHQQPYRSLLLRSGSPAGNNGDGIARLSPDHQSLHLLEEALELYRSVPVLDPDQAPPSLKEACAVLDCELMRLPLLQAGLTEDRLGPPA